MNSRIKGVILVASGATMISFAAVFAKIAGVSPTTSAFYRMLFGGLVLGAIVLLKKERFFQSRVVVLASMICGLLFAVDLTLWHRSINYVGPGLATILANFQVFFLAAFGVAVLRERLNIKLAISIPLAVAGLFLIVGLDFTGKNPNYGLGVILGILTAISYSSYMVVFRHMQSKSQAESSFSAVTIISLTSALALAALVPSLGENFTIPDARSLSILVAYGIVGQVLGWVLIAKGVPHVPTSQIGLILLTQPALAFIWDMIFFSRPTSPIELLGAVIAIVAIYLGSTSRVAEQTRM